MPSLYIHHPHSALVSSTLNTRQNVAAMQQLEIVFVRARTIVCVCVICSASAIVSHVNVHPCTIDCTLRRSPGWNSARSVETHSPHHKYARRRRRRRQNGRRHNIRLHGAHTEGVSLFSFRTHTHTRRAIARKVPQHWTHHTHHTTHKKTVLSAVHTKQSRQLAAFVIAPPAKIVSSLCSHSPQRSGTLGWPQSRRPPWRQHVRGLWCGSSDADVFCRPGTVRKT